MGESTSPSAIALTVKLSPSGSVSLAVTTFPVAGVPTATLIVSSFAVGASLTDVTLTVIV